MGQRKKIKQAIIVEGKYDKIKLLSIFDSIVVETNGFRIFSDCQKLNLIRRLAVSRGIIILTDSDSAGFIIRNYLKGAVHQGQVLNAFIPDICGKEKRKRLYSKEGKLGVEGVPDDIIINAVLSAGSEPLNHNHKTITNIHLYNLGLSGKNDSVKKRKKLLKSLNLPEYISSKVLVDVLNSIITLQELQNIVRDF